MLVGYWQIVELFSMPDASGVESLQQTLRCALSLYLLCKVKNRVPVLVSLGLLP